MLNLRAGLFTARLAQGPEDIARAQQLRWLAFHPGADAAQLGGAEARLDADSFDARCRHVLLHERHSGALVGCFRLLVLPDGSRINDSYSAQFYDLHRLAAFPGPIAEVGRFCLHPGHAHPQLLRLGWAALTRLVDAAGVQLLFGCSSFRGVELATYGDAFALLKDRHLAPARWRPEARAPLRFHYAQALAAHRPDPQLALLALPPLLRSYLAMGGWVSDHAVVDPGLNTLHVFTALQIAAIPPARARALRALAAAAQAPAPAQGATARRKRPVDLSPAAR
jgi:putative hemolysin